MFSLSSIKSGIFRQTTVIIPRCLYSNELKARTTQKMKPKQTTSISKKAKLDRDIIKQRLQVETPKKFTVCVEGNIASGKTTFLEYFKSEEDVEILEEPVRKWRDIQGFNLLAKMYEDPTRWSLTLQTYVQLTMLKLHTKEQTKRVKLMERSIFSARHCFVENLHNSGKMPDMEYVVLSEWFDWIVDFHKLDVDLIVYLRSSPEVVHERIKQRCRNEEQTIPLDYLKSLHELHEDWLIEKTKFDLPTDNILVLDANDDVEKMKAKYHQEKRRIMFMKENQNDRDAEDYQLNETDTEKIQQNGDTEQAIIHNHS